MLDPKKNFVRSSRQSTFKGPNPGAAQVINTQNVLIKDVSAIKGASHFNDSIAQVIPKSWCKSSLA